MDSQTNSPARNLWVWCAVTVGVLLMTLVVSNANDTPGDNNDTGIAELANGVGFIAMLLVIPLLVAAIIQTVSRRRRSA